MSCDVGHSHLTDWISVKPNKSEIQLLSLWRFLWNLVFSNLSSHITHFNIGWTKLLWWTQLFMEIWFREKWSNYPANYCMIWTRAFEHTSHGDSKLSLFLFLLQCLYFNAALYRYLEEGEELCCWASVWAATRWAAGAEASALWALAPSLASSPSLWQQQPRNKAPWTDAIIASYRSIKLIKSRCL